jgi:hypothetical protein
MKAFHVTYKAYLSVVEYRTALVYATDSADALSRVRDGEEEDIIDYDTGDSDTNEISFEGAEVTEVNDERTMREMQDKFRERGIPLEKETTTDWPGDKVEVSL